MAFWLTHLSMMYLCQKTTVPKTLINELQDARGYSFHFKQAWLRSMQTPQSYWRDEEKCRQTDRQMAFRIYI